MEMEQDLAGTGKMFDIHCFSVHDGLGIRTTVFYEWLYLSLPLVS